MADNNEPMSDARLAEIRATLADERGMGDITERLNSEWLSIRFSAQVAQAAIDLLVEVERLRIREAEFEKQRADYHHVVSELSRCERDHDVLLHENDGLRSKLTGADQRAATYSNELVMALDAGKRIVEERDELRTENTAMRELMSELISLASEQVICHRCHAELVYGAHHTPDCPIAKARALFAPGESEA